MTAQKDWSPVLHVLRDVAKAYGGLLKEGGEGALTLVAVTATAERGIDATRASAPAGPGWERRQSRARRSDEPLLADAGALVKGEWVDADGAGLLLHPDPDAPGCLIRWRYAERLLTDNAALQSEEIPALRERIVVLAPPIPKQPPSKEALQPVLVYHVFWGADDPGDPHAIHRLFHRFAGFAEENVVIRQPRRNTP